MQINDYLERRHPQLSLSTLAERFSDLVTGGDAPVDTTTELAPITFATIDEANEIIDGGDILLLTGVTYANEAAVLADLQDTGSGRGFFVTQRGTSNGRITLDRGLTRRPDGGYRARGLLREIRQHRGHQFERRDSTIFDTFLTLSGVARSTPLPTFDVEIIA